VPRLRLRRVTWPHTCGADGPSCGSSGTRDVPMGRRACAPMPGGMGTRDAVCHRYPQFKTIHGLHVSSGYRRGLHDLRIHDRLEHRESVRRQRREIGRQRGHISAAHLNCEAELGGRRPDVGSGSTDCQSHIPRGSLRLRQQRDTLIEDSKQGLHNKFFTGGGWT
jgi:hypothetical protein